MSPMPSRKPFQLPEPHFSPVKREVWAVLGCESSCAAESAVVLLMAGPSILPTPGRPWERRKGPWEVQRCLCWASGKESESWVLRGSSPGTAKPRLVAGSTFYPGREDISYGLLFLQYLSCRKQHLSDPTLVRTGVLLLCPYNTLPAHASLSPADCRNARMEMF